MLSSLVFGIYFYLIHAGHQIEVPSPERDTKLWTHFAKLHVMASVTFHSISIWLTVYLACFRCIYLASASSSTCGVQKVTTQRSTEAAKSSKCCSSLVYVFRRCLLQCRTYGCTLFGIMNICMFCILFCFPAYIYPTVREIDLFNDTKSANSTKSKVYYYVDQSDLNIKTGGLIFKIMFYTQAIFGKFLPCLLLVTFSSILIRSLIIINRNNKRLNKKGHLKKQRDKTTWTSCLSRPCRLLAGRIFASIPTKFSQKSNNATHVNSASQKKAPILKRHEEEDCEKCLNDEPDDLIAEKKSRHKDSRHSLNYSNNSGKRLTEIRECPKLE